VSPVVTIVCNVGDHELLKTLIEGNFSRKQVHRIRAVVPCECRYSMVSCRPQQVTFRT
jgi:hypothetical protein